MGKTRNSVHRHSIIAEIDEESFLAFHDSLSVAEKSGSSMELMLCSNGGSAYHALAFAARIRRSDVAITCTAYGIVASAAVLILAACKVRKMTAEAWVMVHEDQVSELEGSTTSVLREAKHMMALEDQWNELMHKYTGKSASIWTGLHEETTYLNAEDCLELGLITEIV